MKRESMLLLKLCGLVALVAGLVSAGNPTSSAADQPYEVTVERGVAAKMRDAVLLHADIYRPKADGKHAVLPERTPYNKAAGHEIALKAPARGYALVIQD